MARKKPIEQKRIPIQASVLPELLAKIEKSRGLIKRSTFMNSILEDRFR
jgi:hypothetical protein